MATDPPRPDDAPPTLSYERTPRYVPVARFAESAEAAMAAAELAGESLDFELVEHPKLQGLGDQGTTLVVAEEDVRRAVQLLSATPARKWLLPHPLAPEPDPDSEPDPAPSRDPSLHPSPVLAYHTPRGGRTITAVRCADAGEAELICGELRAAGVPAVTVNHHTAALGPYAGGSEIEVQVAEDDRERAAEVLARLPGPNDLEPEPEPPDGSADFATGDDGGRVPLAVAAEFATAREMHEAAAALGSARVRSYLPNLVPRKPGPDGPRPAFRVRVAQEDLGRARDVLNEAADPDEPRCPRCASWRVHPAGGSFFSWLAGFVAGAPADGVRRLQCLSCRHQFTWGNPKGTFEVLPAPPAQREE